MYQTTTNYQPQPKKGKCPSCGRCLDCNPPVAPVYPYSPWTWPNGYPQVYPTVTFNS